MVPAWSSNGNPGLAWASSPAMRSLKKFFLLHRGCAMLLAQTQLARPGTIEVHVRQPLPREFVLAMMALQARPDGKFLPVGNATGVIYWSGRIV